MKRSRKRRPVGMRLYNVSFTSHDTIYLVLASKMETAVAKARTVAQEKGHSAQEPEKCELQGTIDAW